MRRPMRRPVLLLCALLVPLAACTSEVDPGAEPASTSTAVVPSATGTTRDPSPTGPTPARRVRFDVGAAFADVRLLAADVGPREATSRAYRRAAGIVHRRLAMQGYDVRRQPVRVPAGTSWGVPVGAGRTVNVVAVPPGFRPGKAHLLVGAHLDTVPQAPGAVDNASGVAVMLELARLAAAAPTRRPVVFVAFGAEEPRGPGDDQHHFGSRAYVDAMPTAQRRALVGMVSLDRVGTGRRAPVCTGGQSPPQVQRALLRAARRVGVPTRACENRTSDHWSFEKAGVTVARVGGNEYAAYHSARDRPGVVQPSQLGRTGRLIWEWLRLRR